MRLNPARTEIIQDFEAMVRERLQAYHAERKTLPTKILFYRDGVSEGQYATVREFEVAKIQNAYRAVHEETDRELAGKPVEITAIITAKRHHVRFFPAAKTSAYSYDRNGNLPAGTCVETGVTSPYFLDFYLQSHHGLQGTARPAHYFVLENGMKLSSKDLQELTFKLCYTYQRATIGVSYAPPAYYADRLCERGRAYMREFIEPTQALREMDDHAVREKIRKAWTNNGQNAVNPWHSSLDKEMFWL